MIHNKTNVSITIVNANIMSLCSRSIGKELLNRVAAGDDRAFAEVFHACYNQVKEFVQILNQDTVDVEEIVQEVFTKIWVNRESLKSIRQFDDYLFIITRNHTLNHLRNRAREEVRMEVYLAEQAAVEEISETTTYTSRQELVEKAVELLPPQQKKVFALRLQGIKNPEISQRLNLSIESVKKYQHLAMKFVSRFVKSEAPAYRQS